MKRNEKILLASLLGILVIWQGQPIVHALFVQPVEERDARIRTLSKSIGEKRVHERELELAGDRLKQLEQRSLPPDPLIASALYQNWLIDLATRSKWSSVVVSANRVDAKPKGGTYYVISATIKAQSTLGQMCDFLHAFHQSGLLHRVVRIGVEAPRHEGDPLLELTLQVEGLSLLNSPSRTTLFVDPSQPPTSDVPLKTRDTYSAITAKNLFRRGNKPMQSAPKAAPVVVKEKPKLEDGFDPAEFVYLIASFSTDESADAWLYDRASNKRMVLTEGTPFEIAGVKGTVTKIGNDFITVQVDAGNWRLDLGSNLRQMHKLQ